MLLDTTYLVVPVAGSIVQRSLPAHARAVDERAVPEQQPRHGQVPAVTRLVQRGPAWPVLTVYPHLNMATAGCWPYLRCLGCWGLLPSSAAS